MEQRKAEPVNYSFRLLYALGMIFVVSGHAGNGGMTLFYDWFPPYAFHMGLFVFCSGYFYKDSYERDVPGFLKRKLKTLILPMYLWNLFYGILVMLLRKPGFTIGMDLSFQTLVLLPLYEGSQFEYNMGAWFVVPLFIVEAVTVVFRRVCPGSGSRKKEIALFLLSLLLGALGIWLARNGFRLGWRLTLIRALYFLPFYSLGIFYRRVLEKFDLLSHGKYLALCLMAQFVIIFICGRIPYYTLSRCDDFLEGGIMPFIVGFVAIAFWLRIAKILEPSLAREKWVNAIAANGYSIMVNQYLGFMLVKAGFAALKSFIGVCQDFDIVQFKTNLAYFYVPGGNLSYIIYLVAGLAVPILMQKLVDFASGNIRRTLKWNKAKV